MSQERFQTSREVYHRIRWDPRLDAREFVIGYDSHGEALEEMPFGAFVPDGEIPWHRVWFFKRGHQVVWDRRQRIDVLDSLTPPEEARTPPRASPRAPAPGDFTPLMVYRYDVGQGGWSGSSGRPSDDAGGVSPSPARLTVATFNVLFDLYDAELLDTARRTPAALALLRACDADVLALQEVTPAFLRALLAEPWVRERYEVSDGPDAATVEPSGQVLLSRIPFASLCQRVFSRDKRVIAGRLAVAGRVLWVATLHLRSNRDASGAGIRAEQVRTLIDWAASLGEGETPEPPDLVLAGDFNFADGAPEAETFARAGFVDAWPALRPGESGETYNPKLNALAALTTVSGRSQRLDRVLVSSLSGGLVPASVELFGEAPLAGPPSPGGDPLFPSDHFGLRCVLRRAGASVAETSRASARADARVHSAPLVHHTAVVLIPPHEVWPPIQAIRVKYDAKVARWMPHVTLLYPFVPEEYFDEAEALIAEALRNEPSFQVTLSRFGHFDHRASVTAWLRPDDQPHGALKALHVALEAALPACHEQGHKSAQGFTPHLSVGQLPRAGAAETARTLAAWERDWRPVSFEAREVCLIRRKGNGPFEVIRRVSLGGTRGGGSSRPRPSDRSGESGQEASLNAVASSEDAVLGTVLAARGEQARPEARKPREAAVARLAKLCEALGAELLPYGSYLLGTDGAGSDVDAVAIGPATLSREDFSRALTEQVVREEGPGRARFVADAAIPLVKLSLDGVSFDLSYASRPEGVEPCPPELLLARHGEQLDMAGFRSVNGWADTKALLDSVTREGAGVERFRTVLRAVKTWAKARGLYSHALGYLGGLSWAVLVAWVCTRAPRDATGSDVALLEHFFETFSAWPWPQPVTLTPETARYRPEGRRDLLPVIAPALPPRNTARNVSRSTFRVLRDELARAHTLVKRARTEGTEAAWDALFEPVDLARETQARLVLSIEAPTPEAREGAMGWVLGHLTALVYGLEGDRRFFARPLLVSGATEAFVIGLSARTPEGIPALFAREDSPLARAVADFRASFLDWSHRPSGTTLEVELVAHG